MSCRCHDITLCQQDLDILDTMLRKLDDISWDDGTAAGRLYSLGEYSNDSISPDNLNELTYLQSHLHDGLHEGILDMMELCRTEQQRLNSDLSDMEAEDEEYHEEDEED